MSHWSSCAVFNEPALPKGECNCGNDAPSGIEYDPKFIGLSKLRLEIWNSSENREERHYFLNDFQPTAYQQSPYIWGYNPAVISEDKVKKILEIIES